MEEDDPPDVKEEKPETLEEDQVPVGPVQVKIIKIGGDDKAGKGALDHLKFVEMAKLARQAVAIANKVGGKGNKRKQLFVPHSTELASDVKVAKEGQVSKDGSNNVKDLKVKRRTKEAERRRKWRATLSDEKRAEIRKQDAERRRKWRASLSEEERAILRQKSAEQKRKQMATWSDEKLAENRRKNSERVRRKRVVMTPEEIESCLSAENERRGLAMTPEEMEEFRAHLVQRKQAQTEAEKEILRQRSVINRLMKKARMTDEEKEQSRWKHRMSVYAKQAKMTKEEREQDLQRRMEAQKKWRQGLSGEKLERYKESLNRSIKKYQQTHQPKKGNKTYIQKYYQKKVREETPEERWKRLRVFRICQAKRLLKRKLEREGFPQEEMEEKLKDLVRRMKEEPMPPPEAVSAYKPRPRKNPKAPVADQEPKTSTVKVTRSKYNCSSGGSIDSSLFRDLRTTATAPLEPPAQLFSTHLSTDYFAGFNERTNDVNDDDEADFSDAFNHCDIQIAPDPLENEDEDDIEEFTNSYSAPTPPQLEPPAQPQSCPHCPLTFNCETLLKDHLRSSHLNKCFKCPKCKEIVFSPKELSDHFKTHQSQPQKQSPSASTSFPFTCSKCPSSVGFQSQEKLSEHVRIFHPGSFFPCRHCKVVMYSKPSLATHLNICKMTSLICVDPRQGRKCTDW